MSDRTGKKFAGLGFAVAALAIAAIPATGLLADRAIGSEVAADAIATHDANEAIGPVEANEASPHDTAAGVSSAALDAGRINKGREIFDSWSCSACHTLADAKASGSVGPSLDGNANLTEAFITSRVTDGQGAMPAFGGQLSKEELADLVYYLTHVTAK